VGENLRAQITLDTSARPVYEKTPAEAGYGDYQGHSYHEQHEAADPVNRKTAAGDEVGNAFDQLRNVELSSVGDQQRE
jgi:hypothetical protein